MQFTDLLTKVNRLTSTEEVAVYFKALRQDEIIWNGVQDFAADPANAERIIEKGGLLDTKTLSLLAIDPEIDPTQYPNTSFSREVLERLMFEYEAYIQAENAVTAFSQVSALAAALIEKRKITAQWKNVILEITSRKKIASADKFEQFWKSIFAVAINLANDRDELLTDLLGLQQEMGLGVFIHAVLCLAVADAQKTDLLVNHLQNASAQMQSHALKLLHQSSAPELVQSAASRLFEKYSSIDLSEQNYSNYWDNSASSLQFALHCQYAADVANFAGESDAALALANKSLEILAAIGAIAKIKKARLLQDENPSAIEDQFSATELAQPEVAAELIYANSGNQLDIPENEPAYLVKVIHQAKDMVSAGNADLAGHELTSVFGSLSDGEIEEVLFKGSRFNQNPDAAEILNTMIESNAAEQAARVAKILLRRNPADESINEVAARAFEKAGEFSAEKNNWETLLVLKPDSSEVKRKLGKSYLKAGDKAEAYAVLNSLVSGEQPAAESDLLEFATTALEMDKNDEAINAANRILEQNSDHPAALTLAGLAFYKKGEIDSAMEKLKKSIEIPGDDPRAWIVLSEIYAQNGNMEESLNLLKEGLAANPGQTLLENAYAKGLMQNGSSAEAYPILRRLSDLGSDRDIDLLLIDAMKQLGIEDIGIVLEELKKRYPHDVPVQAEYGKNLVDNGILKDGLSVLREIKSELVSNPDWVTAYVEALIGKDLSNLHIDRRIVSKDLAEASGLIDAAISMKPEDARAKVLKGELLVSLHRYEEAMPIFAQIFETEKTIGEKWLARVNSDLAKAAAAVGKHEIALASIEEAIHLQPDWIGLQQEKAEILMLAGESAKAEAQLIHTLEVCPDSAEKSIWSAQVLQKLGKTNEADIALKSAIEKSPAALGLQVMAAELHSGDMDMEESVDYLESIKSLVETSDSPQDIIRAAAVLAREGQTNEAVGALTRAGELGSADAKMNLAGFYRTLEDCDHCLETLEQINGLDKASAIFKAEVEFHAGKNAAAYKLLETAEYDSSDFEFQNVFLPEAWKEFTNSSNPKRALKLNFNLQSGNHHDSLEIARAWVESDPDNHEARIFAAEIALACGAEQDYASFLNIPRVEGTDRQSRQLEMLRIERDQDQNIFALSAEETGASSISGSDTDPALITRVRALAAEGQLPAAEMVLIDYLSNFSKLFDASYVYKIGLLRNTLKAAVSVNRWKEAIGLYKPYGKVMNANDGVKLSFLESLVRAVEFFNSAQGLSVETHLPWNALFVAYIQEEINNLVSEIGDPHTTEAQHWVLRGNLALNPDQENIRALALIAPHADDAAAMMAALRATDQINIALQVSRKFENEPCVLFELAQCCCDTDPEKAIDTLSRSLEFSPDQPLALRMISKLLEKMGNRTESAQKLELAINLWPNEPRWHTQAAELLTGLGNLDAPVDHLKAALELNPNDVETVFQLGTAHVARKDPASALKYLQDAAAKAPNRADVWEAISDAHQLAGEGNLALEAAEKASKVDPFAVRPHLQAGKVNWSNGEIEKAVEQVRLAISLNPDDADSYVFLAHLLEEKGENGKALETLERASKCETATVRTMIEHATLLKKINGAAAARDLLSEFSQKYPENPELLKLLAEAEKECGDLRKAEAAAKRALEFHPDETELHLFLGGIQEKNGNLDQAAHYFSQAIARNPKDKEGYLQLSRVFARQREFGKAREVLEEGIQRIPEDIDLYLECANLLKDAKDYKAAEQMLRKASAIDPRNLAVHRQLGAVLALNLVHKSQEVSSHL